MVEFTTLQVYARKIFGGKTQISLLVKRRREVVRRSHTCFREGVATPNNYNNYYTRWGLDFHFNICGEHTHACINWNGTENICEGGASPLCAYSEMTLSGGKMIARDGSMPLLSST